MSVHEEAMAMKSAAPRMAASSLEARNRALENIAAALEAGREEIFAANAQDLASAEETGVPASIRKRLVYDETKMRDSIAGLRQLETLPDPVGRILLSRELNPGLVLTRVTVPIGVIGVIFEARPDAMVQVASLCIRSGNCAILKGGKETAATNRVLFGLIHQAAEDAGLPEGALFQAQEHSEIDELLSCDDCVDLLIPRGSNRFVRYIMEHTKIPVMGHSSGICHIYVDKDADLSKAVPVILDAKTQYPAACNAVETLLINRALRDSFLPVIAEALTKAGVKINGTEEVRDALLEAAERAPREAVPQETSECVHGCAPEEKEQEKLAGEDSAAVLSKALETFEVMQPDEFSREYGDLAISVRLVDGVEEAVEHINRYGSHHTDAILTGNDAAAAYFQQMVDSAGVYRNCSTRFADGYRYGFGAEVGISTGKLHARGPVGLEGLVTYKYRLDGNGDIVGDYAGGRKQFHHRDLPIT